MTDACTTPQTPQSKTERLVPDTVPVPRSTSQIPYRTGDLARGREAVLKDLGRYLEIPYDILVHSIFGPSPNIAQIRQELLDANVLVAVADNDPPRWARFPVTPGESRDAEDVVFSPLADIVLKIFGRGTSSDVSYHAAPSVTPLSERRNTSRPDAYITYKRLYSNEKSDKTHWWNIAVPFEFKKENNAKTRDDNIQKIIWSLHNSMREDPRRRFTLGITVEDTDMRIWCHNRAFLAVSTPLNFMEAIDDVISLFYSIGCQNEAQLGWDPTVQRFRDENQKVQYKFTIGGETFTTTREIATYGADPMVSRGTRVYEAKDENGDIVAIKDSWRDRDREMEGLILENIFRDIRKEFGEDEAVKAKKYFVQIRISENVIVSGKVDGTLLIKGHEDGKLVAEGQEKDGLKWVRTPEPALSRKLHLPSTGHIPTSNQPPQVARYRLGSDNNIPQRIHTRTVFEDVGEALMNVKNLRDCFICLSGTLEALRYLHGAGWVHRDFSVSNVLWFARKRIGKLSDFEYAKKVGSETTHDVRTGTMQFMAVEVEVQDYLFLPKLIPRKLGESPRVAVPPFRMNFLHDLESEWWTAMWMLFYHTDAASPTDKVDGQLEHFDLAFPDAVAAGPRRNFFEFLHKREPAWETLSQTYKDQCSPVVELADDLLRFYIKVEERFPDILLSGDTMQEAHEVACDAHSKVIQNLQGSNVLLQPLRPVRRKRDEPDDSPTRTQTKRSRQS